MYCCAVYDIGWLRKIVASARARGKRCEAASCRNICTRAGDAKTHCDAAADRNADGDD